MKKLLAAVALCLATSGIAAASSHREAPYKPGSGTRVHKIQVVRTGTVVPNFHK